MDVTTAQALLLELRSQLGDAGIQALLCVGSQVGTAVELAPISPPQSDAKKQADGTPKDGIEPWLIVSANMN